jgi:hypothetical protein
VSGMRPGRRRSVGIGVAVARTLTPRWLPPSSLPGSNLLMFTRSYGSELAFYEVAATLIPLFLLAGVVFDRMKPRQRDSAGRVSKMILLIPALGAWAILAEVTAISALVSANSSLLTRLTVASALSAGMVAVVASVWQPWFERYKMMRPDRAQAAWRPTVALLLCAFAATVWIMEAAVSGQRSEEASNEIRSEMNRNDSATFAAEDRIASLSAKPLAPPENSSLVRSRALGAWACVLS